MGNGEEMGHLRHSGVKFNLFFILYYFNHNFILVFHLLHKKVGCSICNCKFRNSSRTTADGLFTHLQNAFERRWKKLAKLFTIEIIRTFKLRKDILLFATNEPSIRPDITVAIIAYTSFSVCYLAMLMLMVDKPFSWN